MIILNDYLYSGHTLFRILQNYAKDLRASAERTGNEIDKMHCELLLQVQQMLEHNDFLTAQSQKIREFYKYMAKEYPFLAFTFKGRIKSLIRTEEKFNGYIVEYIYDHYTKYNTYPTVEQIKERIRCFRDLIAYRIVISLPDCQVKPGEDRREQELQYLYRIAGVLPGFLEQRGFRTVSADGVLVSTSSYMEDGVRPFYRDYICGKSENEYRSLHVTFFDEGSGSYIELQLRTKEMDDTAEIGSANHTVYEKEQEKERTKRAEIPEGECIYFDEAFERGRQLLGLELNKLNVNMFAAVNNSLTNDGCGLYRGRLILPYEHLSRFQNDLID